jgi:hypothetical protein
MPDKQSDPPLLPYHYPGLEVISRDLKSMGLGGDPKVVERLKALPVVRYSRV